MRPLYSDSITTNTKDACHKELTNTSESWSKAIAVWSFTKQSDWTAFCKAPVSKSIKNHIESGLLEQKTWTESRNKTNTPSRRAGTGRFTSSAHNNAIATDRPSTTSWQKKKNIGVLQESLQRRIFTQRTNASLVTPCFARHSYLRTDSHCSLMDWFYLM